MNNAAKKVLTEKSPLPRTLALVGVLLMLICVFLPYITAVGKMAEYIENNPDRIEIQSLNMTASDLADVSILSVSKLITGVYGEDDAAFANVIVWVFCGLFTLTALFVFLKKPVCVIIFDLLAFAVFAFLNFLMKDDFISPDKYAWGIGYYAIVIAHIAIVAGTVWTLIQNKAVNTAS